LRYVIDASVVLAWFVKGVDAPYADAVLTKMVDTPQIFAVPELFLYEVFSVLHRHHPYPQDILEKDVERLIRAGILRYPMTPNISTKAERFIRKGLTGYDSVYAALAEELEAKWLTLDTKAHFLIKSENLSVNLYETLPPDL
jgi:predicted nucleic acid-binding protein